MPEALSNLIVIAEQFEPRYRILEICEFGSGNINETFLVTLDSLGNNHFVLQRLNTLVFRQPELVMLNVRTATAHAGRHLKRGPLDAGRRWEIPRVLLTADGRDHWLDSDGSFWRAISFIEDARSFETIKDIDHASEVGYALGVFHALLSDLSAGSLFDTLEGFHITPRYLRHYEKVLAGNKLAGSPEVDYCMRFIAERSSRGHILEDAINRGALRLRPIHGDPKVDNIMMDTATGQAVSIVDLDTVKPGLVHYDIGDCLRSGCNPLGEETEQWETTYFDLDLCTAIMRGYFSTAKGFLAGNDFFYMYDSIRLIPFELGLRFFTDYMEGNVYFKVRHPEHNLARALVQFKLAESIESQEAAIRSMIRDLNDAA